MGDNGTQEPGMTFDRLSLDLSRGMFAAGQLYVALSRVRSLDGLYLSKNLIPQYAHTSREVLRKQKIATSRMKVWRIEI